MIKLGLEVSNLPEGQYGRGLPNSNRALLDHVRSLRRLMGGDTARSDSERPVREASQVGL